MASAGHWRHRHVHQRTARCPVARSTRGSHGGARQAPDGITARTNLSGPSRLADRCQALRGTRSILPGYTQLGRGRPHRRLPMQVGDAYLLVLGLIRDEIFRLRELTTGR